jgi:phosphohistidine swiveling domain-containing protein
MGTAATTKNPLPIFGAIMDDEGIGGKARSLSLCARLGISVPPWFVIPAETARLQPWRHDPQIEKNLLALADHLQSDARHAWMVRSSAAMEDSDVSAHAGEFRSERIDSLRELISSVEAVASTKSRPPYDGVTAGVVVQRYIAGTYSGVAFSCKPSGGTPDEYYCEFVEGGCEQLVSGRISPKNFSIDVLRGKIVPIGSDSLPPVVLSLAETLAEWMHDLETETGKLYDIEWIYDGLTLWCVQARPITRLQLDSRYLPAFCATAWFYDERFRAPLTPITRSTLMQLIFKSSLQDPVQMSGGTASPADVFYYGGRPYVPHRFYKQMFAGTPLFMLTPYLRQLFPNHCRCDHQRPTISQTISSIARKALSLVATAPQWLWNRHAWNRFKADLDREIPSLRRLPSPASPNWFEHWRSLDRWNERFLVIHRWSILLADYSNTALQFLLRLLPSRYASSLNGRFIAGLNLPTAEANSALVAVVHDGPSAQAEFMERFGHRAESLDYSQSRWAERFEGAGSSERFLFLNSVQVDPARAKRPRLRIRILSELLEMREQQRFEWEKILALQRSMIREMGARLCRENTIPSIDDIWFLYWDELPGLLTGTLRIDQSEMECRKHNYRVEKSVRVPQMIPELHEEHHLSLDTAFTGLGASSGKARGPVLVIREADEVYSQLRKGVILVMSDMSPADTPLLLGISGLVLERGGLLSHAAIMAREYGIPLVTAASRATEVLQTGMVAVIDGDTGTVEFDWRSDDGNE